eukprot:scaffold91225_cov27-Tisochrysis_lutea.AAC.2
MPWFVSPAPRFSLAASASTSCLSETREARRRRAAKSAWSSRRAAWSSRSAIKSAEICCWLTDVCSAATAFSSLSLTSWS